MARHDIKIWHVRHAWTLVAECDECRRSAQIDLGKLGDDLAVETLRERIRCRQCGAQPKRLVLVQKAPRPPYRGERDGRFKAPTVH